MPPLTRALWVLFFLASPAFAQADKTKAKDELPTAVITVAGVVFDDVNGDGERQAQEKGLAGVWVSNGIDLKKTDAQGKWSLPLPLAKTRTVFVVIPGDCELTDAFYFRADPKETKDRDHDFALRKRQTALAKRHQFVQVTDVHASTSEHAISIAFDMQEINKLDRPVEFVVSTGDLTNNATKVEYDNYAAGMKTSKRPVRHVIGNHDVDGAKSPLKTGVFESYFGPPYYAFEIGHTAYVVFDSNHWNAQQQDWVKWYLGSLQPERTVVAFQHHPPKKELLDNLAQYNCRGIFSGHVHGTRINEYRGIFNCNSTTLIMGAIDRTPRGFQLVTVDADKVRSQCFIGGVAKQWSLDAAEKRNGEPRLLAGPASTAPEVKTGAAWPMAHGDAGSSGVAKDALTGPLTPAWSAYAGGIVHMGSPVVADGRVFIGTLYATDFDNCGVTCLDAATGRPLWRTRTDGCIKNTPATADGRVYAISLLGTVYCLDAKDGHTIWKVTMGEPAVRWDISAPKIADGVVYVGTGNHFAALSAKDGAFVWAKKFVTAVVAGKGGKEEFLEKANVIHDDWWPSYYQTCAVAKDVVHLGGRTGLHTIDRKTGHLLRTRTRTEKAGRAGSLPVVADGRLYASFARLMAYAGDDAGTVAMTSQALVGDETGTPAVSGGIVVIGTAKGAVIGVDAGSGKTLWQFQTGKAIATMLPYQRNESTISSSPAISGNTVFIGGNDGVLYALDLKTGKLIDKQAVGVPLCSSPAVSGNAVFIAGYDGVVRCWTGR